MRFIWLLLWILICEKSFSQVNLQTGSAEQVLPLIDYTDSKAGLSMGVGLNYSSGNGLQVNDIASDVGTGWSLDVGGAVLRIQNGEPDDQFGHSSGQTWASLDDDAGIRLVGKSYPSGYMYSPGAGMGCTIGSNFFPVFKHKAVYKQPNIVTGDTEQDKFIYRVNGKSGVFVIGTDMKAASIGESKVKITFLTSDMTNQGIRTRISQFTITTEDGVKYTFSEKSLNRVVRYKYTSGKKDGALNPTKDAAPAGEFIVNRFVGEPLPLDETPYVVSGWFLSEALNTNTGQKITFNYQNIGTDVVTSKLVTHVRNLNESGDIKGLNKNQDRIDNGRNLYNLLSIPSNAYDYTHNLQLFNKLKAGGTSITYNRSISNTKRISNVILPNGGRIDFTYSSNERKDLLHEHALSKIIYSINNHVVRSYAMEYGYMYKYSIYPYTTSFGPIGNKGLRLCLLSVQKIGDGSDNASEPPYKFEYYTGSISSDDDIVPAQNSLSQDHWGYYNGSNSLLSPKEDHDFLNDEENQYLKAVLPIYKNPKPGYAKNGLLRRIIYPTGGWLAYQYQQNKSWYVYADVTSGGVSVSQTDMYNGESAAQNITTEYVYRTLNHSSRWGYEEPIYHSFNLNDVDEKNLDKFHKFPGLQYPEAAISIDWSKVLGKALISAAINIVIEAIVATVASAAVPYVNAIVAAAAITKMILDFQRTMEFHRLVLTNTNNILINPLPSQNTFVEVRTNSPTGYNGKTTYSFTGPDDYPILEPKLAWPFTAYQRVAGWAYGLVKKIAVYDKNDHLVKETSNTYKYYKTRLSTFFHKSCQCATESTLSMSDNDWRQFEQPAFFTKGYHWMTPRFYYFSTGRADLTSTREKIYTNGQLAYDNYSDIINDPVNLLQKGRSIQREPNTLVFQMTYYPADFNISGSALELLKTRNAIHVPVATETWKLKLSFASTVELTDASVTEFKKFSFGSGTPRDEVKPWKLYSLKTDAPILQSVIGRHNPSQLIRNPSYYKLQKEMVYDNDGNLVQTIADDISTTFVNDYKSRYVVATVQNAEADDVAYTSFEADGTGGWQFDAQTIRTDQGLTGTKSLKLGYVAGPEHPTSITKTGLSAQKTYIVSFWQRELGTSGITVNGGGTTELYEKSNGWKFCQIEVSNATQVSITGVGTIDEVRLYPKGAMMATTAYVEGIGKIADCDANNRLTFYQYDGLARLKLIKDEDGNVVKTYEYNYKTFN